MINLLVFLLMNFWLGLLVWQSIFKDNKEYHFQWYSLIYSDVVVLSCIPWVTGKLLYNCPCFLPIVGHDHEVLPWHPSFLHQCRDQFYTSCDGFFDKWNHYKYLFASIYWAILWSVSHGASFVLQPPGMCYFEAVCSTLTDRMEFSSSIFPTALSLSFMEQS